MSSVTLNSKLPARRRRAVAVPRVIEVIDPMQLPGMREFHQQLFAGELRIGRRAVVPVLSIEDASFTYAQLRDQSGEGGSTWPDGKLSIGRDRYRISYDAKVWHDRPWQSGDVPVFNPY
jgi:hypothetical protein